MEIVSLAERPDLVEAQWDLTSVWPEFMLHDPVGDLYYGRLEVWGDYALVAVDGDRVLARGFSVPFAFGTAVGRPDLPDDGWDRVILWAEHDRFEGRQPTTVAGLEISLVAAARGTGLASQMVRAMGDNAAERGFDELVIPVRPSRKHLEPLTSMAEYAARTRDDGLPFDPWLRLHVRAGGAIVGVCSTAMTIAAALSEWRDWTGLPFDSDGEVLVEGALVPVHASLVHDHAVYVEPNVWVRHPTE
jgi:GNAT superfamily N-acetyltransferase